MGKNNVEPPDYNPQEIEPRWQKHWADEGTYQVENGDTRDPYYVLSMYPYPSGPAHMGHVRNYTFGDLLVRYFTMHGYGVLSPIGFDSFGLPAENAAIQTGEHPRSFTNDRIAELTSSILRIGAVYDMRRVIKSHDPDFMHWTQWIFLKLYEAGLAYRANASVNWCPGCQTVLANEQVVDDGVCDRSGDVVEKRELEQWFFKITEYADELLTSLSDIEWPERVKTMQVNWIGRSEGVDFEMAVVDVDEQGEPTHIEVYTTRPDTSFGMTFVVLAPEHPLVPKLTTQKQKKQVEEFCQKVAGRSEIERLSEEGLPTKDRGVFTGSYVLNPFTQKPAPVYLADYVIMEYGTGAVMAVPGEDKRDWDFAETFGLEIIRTVQPPADFEGGAYTGEGIIINSDWMNGLPNTEAKQKAIEWLEKEGHGSGTTRYRLRDWLLSRQRFWGCPIPIIYCEECGIQPVDENDLPVLLPDDVDFLPTGKSPLNFHQDFLNTSCPKCSGPARRETDTMDTFVDSSWYFMRFVSYDLDSTPVDLEDMQKWLPVDQYIGGIEHAVLHLMYARFITKALSDLGHLPKNLREPFLRLFTQGMIRRDGVKMSKSRGNVVAPEEILDSQGADALRLAHCQVKPPSEDVDWEDFGLDGCRKFLGRLWRLAVPGGADALADKTPEAKPVRQQSEPQTEADLAVVKSSHKLVQKLTRDYERWAFNTAVASCMEFLNELYLYVQSNRDGAHQQVLDTALDRLLLVMSPIIPHITAELWEMRNEAHIHKESWPKADEEMLVEELVTLIVQVNGKVKDKIQVSSDISESQAEETARQSEKIKTYIGTREIKKSVVRVPKLVNLVVD